MTDPITEVPPAPFRAVDAFEVWLQGRINLCVSGLQDQITNLQIENNELKKQLGEYKGDVTTKQFNECMENWIEHCDKDGLLDSLKNNYEWADAVAEAYSDNSFEHAVKDVINDKFDLEEMIKDTITDKLSFEVRVS